MKPIFNTPRKDPISSGSFQETRLSANCFPRHQLMQRSAASAATPPISMMSEAKERFSHTHSASMNRRGVVTRSSLKLLFVLFLGPLAFIAGAAAPAEPAQAEQAPGEANDSHASSSAQNKWNWLAGTRWYVPAENLLAYLSDLALTGI